MNRQDWHRVYRVPRNPLARAGLVALGLALVAVSFFLGLLAIAVFFGLAILGAVYLAIARFVQRLRGGFRKADEEDAIQVEYRVVDRHRDP